MRSLFPPHLLAASGREDSSVSEGVQLLNNLVDLSPVVVLYMILCQDSD